MKRTILTGLLAGLLITCTACGTTPTGDEPSTATSSYTASFKVAELQVAVPGGASSLNLPTSNSWGYDSWIFFEVSIPVFNRDEVELDEQMDGNQIPVLTFTPNEGWTRIEENEADGVLTTVWFYSTPVDADQPFLPLFDEWTLTNFRVRNGICGSHTYSEIIEAANKAVVHRYSLQADGINGDPETLWGMVK